MNPYAKYIKYIVTNKRKISEAEISTMLANYTFKSGIPKKLGDPGVPTIPAPLKEIMLRLLYVILELVLMLCLSLYIIDLT